MVDGIRLKQLTVSGFRGYGSQGETIDLSGPMVILSGGNRSGKSSTLNAIEWALYGDEVVGSGKVNIEERKGWLVKNLRCDRASVELVLESDEGDIIVRRSAAGAGGKKSREFYFVDENGEKHDEEEGLWNMLGLGPKDFMSTAYLHQEVIRDLLVTQPSVRKAALDRLLGVSDLRNLFDAFKAIKVKGHETAVDDVYARLENDIVLKASSYKERLGEVRKNGSRWGLDDSDYTSGGLSRACEAALEKLRGLAGKAKVEPASLTAPGKPADFKDFADGANEEINRLRIENPGAGSQRKLDREMRDLDSAMSRLLLATKALKDLKDERRQIEKENGRAEDLKSCKGELSEAISDTSAELSRISDRINVVNETVAYLEKLEDESAEADCPACGQDIVPKKLLESLNALKEKTSDQTRELESKKDAARREVKRLESLIKRLAVINDEELPAANGAKAECLNGLEETLGLEFAGDEDPQLVVENRMKEIEKAVEKNKKQLEDYTAGLAEVSTLLDGAESIADALALEQKITQLNAVKESAEWDGLDEARDRLYDELGYVEKVTEAVEEVLGEVSRRKVAEARGHIADIYGRLVERPDFGEIEIDPDKNYEVFATGGGKREKLVTFFNQGDMNCAALAIFLALGTGRASKEGGASFLMMDDPSQSLDAVQKERLAQVLDEVAGGVQLVLSTMDAELLQSARTRISRKKRIYNLGAWDPKTGPDITEE